VEGAEEKTGKTEGEEIREKSYVIMKMGVYAGRTHGGRLQEVIIKEKKISSLHLNIRSLITFSERVPGVERGSLLSHIGIRHMLHMIQGVKKKYIDIK